MLSIQSALWHAGLVRAAGPLDILIAAYAIMNDATVLASDRDFGFIAQLARECPARIIAEGHIHTPEQAVQALYAGAFALVVGGAITRPAEITARYTAAIKNHK